MNWSHSSKKKLVVVPFISKIYKNYDVFIWYNPIFVVIVLLEILTKQIWRFSCSAKKDLKKVNIFLPAKIYQDFHTSSQISKNFEIWTASFQRYLFVMQSYELQFLKMCAIFFATIAIFILLKTLFINFQIFKSFYNLQKNNFLHPFCIFLISMKLQTYCI